MLYKPEPPLPPEEVYEQIQLYKKGFPTYPMSPAVSLEAVRVVGEHSLCHFDAQTWASAKLNQAPVVLSEDFPVGATVEDVSLENPLAEGGAPAELERGKTLEAEATPVRRERTPEGIGLLRDGSLRSVIELRLPRLSNDAFHPPYIDLESGAGAQKKAAPLPAHLENRRIADRGEPAAGARRHRGDRPRAPDDVFFGGLS